MTMSAFFVEHRLQLVHGDVRRLRVVLDHLGKRLARHMDAAVDAKAGGLPRFQPALEITDVGVAELTHSLRGACGNPLAVVAPNDARTPARHEIVNHELEPGERHTGRHQMMARTERQLLARIKQGNFATVAQGALEVLRGDGFCGGHGVGPSESLRAQARAVRPGSALNCDDGNPRPYSAAKQDVNGRVKALEERRRFARLWPGRDDDRQSCSPPHAALMFERLTWSRFFPSMRTSLVGPARLGEWTAPTS